MLRALCAHNGAYLATSTCRQQTTSALGPLALDTPNGAHWTVN
jgi:hypothetical protein